MNEVTINGRRVMLSRLKALGKGGEAEIYELGSDALKVYKEPNHPDYDGVPHEQRGARERIKVAQQKLPRFPKLPPRVVAPKDLAYGPSQLIAGFTMDLIRGADRLVQFSEPGFHRAGLSNRTVSIVFAKMHETVKAIHAAGAILGDFNDLNVMVKGDEPFFIDADSFQFDRFLTSAYTVKFVDPVLCDRRAKAPQLVKPHNEESDWYAFALMLMQSLLCVGPYGGVYRPKDPKKRLPQDARSLARITVWDPEVKYPLPATPYATLPDELNHQLQLVFEKDWRGEFPAKLFDSLDWSKCPVCGIEHARRACPVCDPHAAAEVKETVIVKGKITLTRKFRRPGVSIAFAAFQGGLKWVYYEGGAYRRENGDAVLVRLQDPHIRFRIQGSLTLAAQNGALEVFDPAGASEVVPVSSFLNLAAFDANERSRFWIQGDRLLRNGAIGPEHIGTVIAGNTFFWVGPRFGFGFYRAGRIVVGFVFEAASTGINDSVDLPRMRGELIDSTCFLSNDLCWFLWSEQERGVRTNHCAVIEPSGKVIAHAEAPEGAEDGEAWLATLRSKCAVGKMLFAATDDGLVRLSVDRGQIVLAERFADTERFVASGDHLFAGDGGLYVVKADTINFMKLNRS
ncbi:MAG: hypothetical protein KGH68_02645 [Patescibacteria group bacterium]|nr:hypothetical protein [Patescibacteria group bacterium]